MATLALGLIGGAIGSSIGGTIAGITAAAIGQTIGAAVGSFIDAAIFAPKTPDVVGQTLDKINVNNATEGIAINRLYGTYRISGNIIWATNFTVVTSAEKVGGKGNPFKKSPKVYTDEYLVSFAVGLCEGAPGAKLKRIFADGQEIDPNKYTVRFYDGAEDQIADSKISAVEGTDLAFRGLCYIVFEDMNLTDFGNRVPNITVEMLAPVSTDTLAQKIKAVSFGNGTGESVYATTTLFSEDYLGNSENANSFSGKDSADVTISMENMLDSIPNVGKINISAAWFGDDLRCGECKIKPRVETTSRALVPFGWGSSGLIRESTILSSQRTLRNARGIPLGINGFGNIIYDGFNPYVNSDSKKLLYLMDDGIFLEIQKVKTYYPPTFDVDDGAGGGSGDGPGEGGGTSGADSGSDSEGGDSSGEQ